MDTLCVQTRADLQADPNALEFFNTFSSKENISKLHEMQQQIQEGYEPGGHRISALRGCLVTAGDILAAAFSGSFFTHIGRSNIGIFVTFYAFRIYLASYTRVLQYLYAADHFPHLICKSIKSRFWLRALLLTTSFALTALMILFMLIHCFAESDQLWMLFLLP
jgi:hypothetical protein